MVVVVVVAGMSFPPTPVPEAELSCMLHVSGMGRNGLLAGKSKTEGIRERRGKGRGRGGGEGMVMCAKRRWMSMASPTPHTTSHSTHAMHYYVCMHE